MRPGRTLRFVSISAWLWAATLSATAHAYDSNAMDRHLQHQQATRVQNHQNDNRQPRSRAGANPCTVAGMPAAERQTIEQNRARIMRERGREAGLEYSRAQGRAYRERMRAQGGCP